MMNRLAAALLLMLTSLNGWAQTDRYQVEILVFETGALKGWTEEYWPWPRSLENTQNDENDGQNASLTGNPATSQTAKNSDLRFFRGTPLRGWDLDSVLAGRAPDRGPAWLRSVRDVTDRHPLLRQALRRLTPSKGYRIILHRAWIQPALPKRQAAFFRLDEAGSNGDLLRGTVRFYKNRFAHMDVDLTLSRRIPASVRAEFARHEGLSEQMLPQYWPFRLKASRKMKSGEWHYLDHPLFGALIVIQRIDG